MALQQEDLQASSQKAPQPSPKDIGFLDPSPQHDFRELRLFHDFHTFHDCIERCESQLGEADIPDFLAKCPRDRALT